MWIGRLRYIRLVQPFVQSLTKLRQYPELSVASYNKNPAALNEPDGIVAVWNLHLLERPEFIFHSQVRMVYVVPPLRLISLSLVRCSFRHLLTLPLQSGVWRNLFRPNITLGHTFQTPPSAQDTIISSWPHTSCIRDADGWYSKRPQLDYEQYGRYCV